MQDIDRDIVWNVILFLEPKYIDSLTCASKTLNEIVTPITSKYGRLWIEKIKNCCSSLQIKNNFDDMIASIQSARAAIYNLEGVLQKKVYSSNEPIDWKMRYQILDVLSRDRYAYFDGGLDKYVYTYADFVIQRAEHPLRSEIYDVNFAFRVGDPLILKEIIVQYDLVLKGGMLHLLVDDLFAYGTPALLSVLIDKWIGEGRCNLNYLAKRLMLGANDDRSWIITMILPHISVSTLKLSINMAKEMKLTNTLNAIYSHKRLPRGMRPKINTVPITKVKGKKLLY